MSLNGGLSFSLLLPIPAGWTAGGAVGAGAVPLRHTADASQVAGMQELGPDGHGTWTAYIYPMEKESSVLFKPLLFWVFCYLLQNLIK